jgi:hypothetical protein
MEKSFTNKIMQILDEYKYPKIDFMVDPTYHRYYDVPSEVLLKVVPFLPKKNYEERQNYSPTLKDFIDVAKMDARILFDLYVISEREDERLSIDGVRIPIERQDLVNYLTAKALDEPDIYLPTEDKKYIYLWWD